MAQSSTVTVSSMQRWDGLRIGRPATTVRGVQAERSMLTRARLQEGGLLGQLLDRVAAIAQDALVAVNVRNLGLHCRRVEQPTQPLSMVNEASCASGG